MRLTVSKKIFLGFALAIVFALGITFFIFSTMRQTIIAEKIDVLMTDTKKIGNIIDRNLFERYGDVQAFAANQTSHNPANWRVPGETNPLVKTMNDYIRLYGIYDLMLLLDLQGNVLAVNDRKINGDSLATTGLYNKNFANETWFTHARDGKFTQGRNGLTGTYIADPQYNPLIADLYGNDGLTMTISAQVKNSSGELIGVWTNFAQFGFIEQIIDETYQHYVKKRIPKTELAITDSSGRILVFYAPIDDGWLGKPYQRNLEVVGKKNLSDYLPVKTALTDGDYAGLTRDAHNEDDVYAGAHKTTGYLDYPGQGWIVTVNMPTDQIWPDEGYVTKMTLGATLALIALVLVVCQLLARNIVSQVQQLGNTLREKVLTAVDMSTQSAEAVRSSATSLVAGAEETSRQGHVVRESAAQAASNVASTASAVEEMNASVNEISTSMKQTAALINQAAHKATETDAIVMSLSKSANQISDVVKLINEIADQTNLLALNAAIEAARAGDAGRGFAVVASEVKKLAEKTTGATRDIQEQIIAIQTASDQSITALHQIVEAVRTVNDNAAGVSSSVQQQSIVADDMARTMTGLSTLVDMVAQNIVGVGQAAEDSARSASDLLGQAESMSKNSKHTHDEVEKFMRAVEAL